MYTYSWCRFARIDDIFYSPNFREVILDGHGKLGSPPFCASGRRNVHVLCVRLARVCYRRVQFGWYCWKQSIESIFQGVEQLYIQTDIASRRTL